MNRSLDTTKYLCTCSCCATLAVFPTTASPTTASPTNVAGADAGVGAGTGAAPPSQACFAFPLMKGAPKAAGPGSSIVHLDIVRRSGSGGGDSYMIAGEDNDGNPSAESATADVDGDDAGQELCYQYYSMLF